MKKAFLSLISASKEEEEESKSKEIIEYLQEQYNLPCEGDEECQIGSEPNPYYNKHEEGIEFWGCLPE